MVPSSVIPPWATINKAIFSHKHTHKRKIFSALYLYKIRPVQSIFSFFIVIENIRVSSSKLEQESRKFNFQRRSRGVLCWVVVELHHCCYCCWVFLLLNLKSCSLKGDTSEPGSSQAILQTTSSAKCSKWPHILLIIRCLSKGKLEWKLSSEIGSKLSQKCHWFSCTFILWVEKYGQVVMHLGVPSSLTLGLAFKTLRQWNWREEQQQTYTAAADICIALIWIWLEVCTDVVYAESWIILLQQQHQF